MTRLLRAGVLGLGMMGRHHVRVLAALEGVELVAAADPGGDVHGAARAAGVPVVPGLQALIGRGLDLCVVAVPTDDHVEAGLALAAAGVATLVEKPLARDLAGGRELVDAFAAAGVVAAVGHVERYNPALQAMRSRLQRGELGRVFQVATRRQGPFPSRVRDVGVVKDLATHDVDLTAWVAGSPYADVSARTAHQAGREHEDLVAAVGRLASGTVVSHLVNWLSPVKERRVVVTGEGGAYEADLLTSDLVHYANGTVPTEWEAVSRFRGMTEGDVVRYAIAKPEPLMTELGRFVAAVRDGTPDGADGLVGLSDGLASLAVAEALLAAAATGGVVEVRA